MAAQKGDWVRFATAAAEPRVLIVSERRVVKGVASAQRREFESVVASIDAVEFAFPRGGPIDARLRGRVARLLDRSCPGLGRCFTRRRPRPGRRYDLMLVQARSMGSLACMAPWSVWSGLARATACYVEDVLRDEISNRRHYLKLLSAFDHVFFAFEGTAEAAARIGGRRYRHLPLSVDALAACPPPRPAERVIDVYAMGRRRPEVHRALLEFCRQQNWFYTFDTTRSAQATSLREHRRHLLDRIRRTRYFIVQPAFANKPTRIGTQEEIGQRYYEGAACGAVLVGDPVRCPSFQNLFGWKDAVVPARPDGSDIADVLAALDADPARVERIRRANVSNTLRLHDHAYRWAEILDAVGLAPLPAFHDRLRRLTERANSIEAAGSREQSTRTAVR